MKRYKQILLAVELEPKSDNLIIKKGKDLAEQFGSKLILVHAVEQFSNYGAAYGVTAGVDVEEVLEEEAAKAMQKVGDSLGIAKGQQVVKIGPAKQVILEEAECQDADLIVVGSHGRHGMRLLLGSTANAVLHSAKCDVLAVRVNP